MSKKIFISIPILLIFLSSCMDLFVFENIPDSYIHFAKINADSTGYKKYFEINNMIQYCRDFKNYTVSSNNEYVIINYGIKGLIQHDLEDGGELKISGDRWIRSCQPDISPDNESVVFASEGDIFLVNSDGTNLINITNTPEDYNSYPSFTEDGLHIVYSSNLNYIENDSLYAICTVTSDGSEINEICTLENADHKIVYPLWSEQYNRYLFHYIRTNSSYDSLSGVWQFQQDLPMQIYNCHPRETKLMISSDGEKILTRSSGDGHIIDIAGNLLFDTETIDYSINVVFLSEDGSYLMYKYKDYNSFYIYEFASMESRRLYLGCHPLLIGDRVYFFVEHLYY